ncbi:disease resistance protein RGA2-like [Chenopodium quinoa]|uniref:disease resistance protein RGA2-like n=1 Tax=Chenopodium quinoa TaxID=63459 RepID=UPI000B774E48|nr:disease resistance protein RGA2-like [Chenopodium quinoa]
MDLIMAEPMLLPIAKSIIVNIASITEINAPNSVVLDLKEIAKNVTAAIEVLEDAESKQSSDEFIRNWLINLRLVNYDIDDLLDEMAFDALQRRLNEGHLRRKIRDYISSSNPIIFYLKWRHKIRGLHGKLGSIVADSHAFGLSRVSAEYSTVDIKDPFNTSSYVREPDVIGRDEIKNDIIAKINDVTELSVLSIVGIGGVGKTALAKLVYQDVQHFDLKFWLKFTDNFDISKIIKGILNDGTPNKDMSMLVEKLHHLLYGNKYLLVLDDVWEEDPEMWLQLKEVMAVGSSGSVILITTRSNKVAAISGTIESCHLDSLPNDVCWSIFKQLAFKKGEEDMYPHLCEIGKSIIQKCLGIPLVIKLLAGLLRSQRDTHKWLQISKSDVFEEHCPVMAVFKLSYCELSSHLKPCFASLSLMKDTDLSTDHVPYIWSALGLLPTEDRNKDIEGLGYSYFMELASKSLIEKTSIHFYGIYLKSEMHDLLLHLAVESMEKELAIVSSNNVNYGIVRYFARHIVWKDDSSNKGPLRAKKARTLRFDLAMNHHVSHSFLESIISNFSYLRILEFGNLWFEELPRSIGKLKHLRYLDVSDNPILRCLPDTICNLLNLETFCFNGCEKLKELPKDVHQLPSLKKFRVTTCQSSLIGSRFSDLSSLQFLSFDSCKSMISMWDNDSVGNLTSLRTLCINDCPKLTSLPNSMKFLVGLQKLHIQNCEELDLEKGEGLLGLQSLRYLFISNLKLASLPNGVKSAAFSLQHLIIRDCRGLVELPDWFCSFTSLLTFEIINCPHLLCLSDSFCHITSLYKLFIKGCPHLSKRCARPGGEDYWLVKHIPEFEHDSIAFIQNQGTSPLNDEVWHLCHIARNGIIHTRLKEANINSVTDLWRLYLVNADLLKKEGKGKSYLIKGHYG